MNGCTNNAVWVTPRGIRLCRSCQYTLQTRPARSLIYEEGPGPWGRCESPWMYYDEKTEARP